MDFVTLQTRLTNLTLDDSTNWIAGWTLNKQAINSWYKDVFEKFININTWAKMMATNKTAITVISTEASLPNDFRALLQDEDSEWVYFKNTDTYWPIKDEINFRIQYWSPSKIIFSIPPVYPVYIDYIKKITDLSANWDTPAIPEELHDNIVDFALVEYFRSQRDWNNVSASLQYAEWKMQEKIEQIM